MNIENLSEGQVVKNYKELCSILEEEVKGGKSKTLQVKDWERFFKYHKEGQKFIIDEIFKEVKEKIIQDKSKNMIVTNIGKGNYSREMFPLVIDFVGTNGSEVYVSRSHMMNSLKLKNKNYDIAYENPKKTSALLSSILNMNIEENDIKTILTSMWSVSQDKIKNAFQNLKKLGYIHWYDDKLLCIYNSETQKREVVLEKDIESYTKCIYEGKLRALAEYFSRNPKKTMSEYVELINCIQEGLDTDLHEDRIKISTQLNQELYLRGLGEKGRIESLSMLHRNGYTYIQNFYYAYSYLKDEDIEWESEILDMAKKQIHIDCFKRAVKNDYILDTFLDKWFNDESKKIEEYKYSDTKKRKFKTELKKHKNKMVEKYDILFDILVNNDTDIDLTSLLNNNKKEDLENIIPF